MHIGIHKWNQMKHSIQLSMHHHIQYACRNLQNISIHAPTYYVVGSQVRDDICLAWSAAHSAQADTSMSDWADLSSQLYKEHASSTTAYICHRVTYAQKILPRLLEAVKLPAEGDKSAHCAPWGIHPDAKYDSIPKMCNMCFDGSDLWCHCKFQIAFYLIICI
jgi:hypothetical protein